MNTHDTLIIISLSPVRSQSQPQLYLEHSSARSASSSSHPRDFLLSTPHGRTEDARSPDSCQTPHAHSPSAIQTLYTLTLAPPLQLLPSRRRLPEQLLSPFCLRRRRADPFLLHNAPHCADDAAVGARGGNDGFDLRSLGLESCLGRCSSSRTRALLP